MSLLVLFLLFYVEFLGKDAIFLKKSYKKPKIFVSQKSDSILFVNYLVPLVSYTALLQNIVYEARGTK